MRLVKRVEADGIKWEGEVLREKISIPQHGDLMKDWPDIGACGRGVQ